MPDILEAKVKVVYNIDDDTIVELEGLYGGVQMFGEHQIMLGIYVEKSMILIPFDRIVSMECEEICITDDEDDGDVAVG